MMAENELAEAEKISKAEERGWRAAVIACAQMADQAGLGNEADPCCAEMASRIARDIRSLKAWGRGANDD